jgi:hypothetical protein
VFKGFQPEQIWSQLQHHTDGQNRRNLRRLEQLTGDEEFLKEIEEGVVVEEQEEEVAAEKAEDFEQYGSEKEFESAIDEQLSQKSNN